MDWITHFDREDPKSGIGLQGGMQWVDTFKLMILPKFSIFYWTRFLGETSIAQKIDSHMQ